MSIVLQPRAPGQDKSARLRLKLTVPSGLRGKTELLEALDAADGSEAAKGLLRPIIEIATRALSFSVQQEVFDNFDRYAMDTTLPQQALGGVRIELELPELDLAVARGDLIDIAIEGSEWIWQTASDGEAAAVFEVICDILEEGLSPKEQQALLDANLSDLAG
ncbi:hypothetical protein [Histidinibacterium aquaticum]|uniref:Uncharacterized protein n=1 Tax=Histidinibacterium aquaticum TaxID=2613962 RepID=A0A5J5GCF8_9RHOB|nr:hypothetical protein [Histidinibacterium aquaticum]KAA9005660.1 hypothetical protein F3S47_17300 [Histidinibacterium aquaticum]